MNVLTVLWATCDQKKRVALWSGDKPIYRQDTWTGDLFAASDDPEPMGTFIRRIVPYGMKPMERSRVGRVHRSTQKGDAR